MNATISRWSACSALILVLFAAPGISPAADKNERRKAEEFQQVEMFSAMKSGEIGVQFIPKDSRSANVLIHNKSTKPLTVKLPAAFAAVHVLAQMGGGGGLGGMGGGGMGGGGMGGMGGGMGGGQGMGGGMGGGGMGGGGMGGGGMGGMGGGGGGGMFHVAPDKIGKISVATVCLEHGKPDPNPRMKYEIRPIDSFTKDERVIELCRMVGRGEVPQNAAQAAVWNLTNGMTWKELAAKDRFRSQITGQFEKFFTPVEIDFAVRIANAATARASQVQANDKPITSETVSPGESQSFAGGR